MRGFDLTRPGGYRDLVIESRVHQAKCCCRWFILWSRWRRYWRRLSFCRKSCSLEDSNREEEAADTKSDGTDDNTLMFDQGTPLGWPRPPSGPEADAAEDWGCSSRRRRSICCGRLRMERCCCSFRSAEASPWLGLLLCTGEGCSSRVRLDKAAVCTDVSWGCSCCCY